MACILNIETATDICSVAIGKEGKLLHQEMETETYAHTRVLTLLIDRCLEAAQIKMQDLDALAISSGPGSYTALRVGTATAKGICYALDLPLISIPTLQLLAAAMLTDTAEAQNLYLPMIDARRMEVYTATYDSSLLEIQEAKAIILDETLLEGMLFQDKNIFIGGNGSEKSKAVLGSENINWQTVRCEALHMLTLSEARFNNKQFEDIAYYEPFYLKSPNITTPKKKLL